MKKRFRLRTFAGLTTLAALAAIVTMILAGGASAIVAGAGFTTNDPNIDGGAGGTTIPTCLNGPVSATPSVNCNLYASKSFVWINGGPTGGQNSLTDGTYFFAVLDPGGQKDPNDGTGGNLSDADPSTNTPGGDAYQDREFTVSGGKIATYIGAGHTTDPAYTDPNGLFINLMPYDDTTNPGGVYILAICQLSTATDTTTPIDGTVTPSACKYDAFKAPLSSCTVDCEPTPFGAISGLKYYDANANGTFDAGELPIPEWNIDYEDGVSGTLTTDANGEFSVTLSGDTYLFGEEHPTNTTGAPFNLPLWTETGNIDSENHTASTGTGESATLSNFIYTVTHTDTGSTSGLDFGNVCIGSGSNARTIGYWSTKQAQSTVTANIGNLVALNLKNSLDKKKPVNGNDFDPSNVGNYQTWLLTASATNMAFMLSAQLSGMELNFWSGKVTGNELIYAPGTNSANSAGFATISAVMAEANAELALHPLTLASPGTGYQYRSYQEALKTALDSANNNVSFVQQPSNGSLPACASTAIAGWTAAAFPTS